VGKQAVEKILGGGRMTPYYRDDYVTIYHGDCREILPELQADVVVTDPVWPNCSAPLVGMDDPFLLLKETILLFPSGIKRLAIHLANYTDPRFLLAVPPTWPFFQAAWLHYDVPLHRGRELRSGDIAYLFGMPPLSEPGRRSIPAYKVSHCYGKKEFDHPSPRSFAHVKFLVEKWSAPGETVMDPFLGSGTTARAAKDCSRNFIGIEIEEKYCEIAAKRMAKEVLPMEARP
jgi:DNA modification methylase